jgi:hypothetical protein
LKTEICFSWPSDIVLVAHNTVNGIHVSLSPFLHHIRRLVERNDVRWNGTGENELYLLHSRSSGQGTIKIHHQLPSRHSVRFLSLAVQDVKDYRHGNDLHGLLRLRPSRIFMSWKQWREMEKSVVLLSQILYGYQYLLPVAYREDSNLK